MNAVSSPWLRRFSARSSLLCGILLVLLGWLFPLPLHALPNDIHLHFLYQGRDLQNSTRDQALRTRQQNNFTLLATELGFALATPVAEPAKTLGSSGVDMGVQLTVADIPETAEHWRRAIEDERPDNNLLITRLRFRKGLPFSFELQADLAFIAGSTHIVGGIAIKWALNEGFFYFPDIAVRGSVNRLFSSRDLDLFNFTGDVIVSKTFGIIGMFALTPFLAYSVVWARANSQVLDPTPKRFDDNESPQSGNFVFATTNNIGSRVSFGLQFTWFILSLTLEGSFAIPHFTLFDPDTNKEIAPATVGSFNGRFSFTF